MDNAYIHNLAIGWTEEAEELNGTIRTTAEDEVSEYPKTAAMAAEAATLLRCAREILKEE